MTFQHEPRTATGHWILVANRGRARILSQSVDSPDQLEEITSLEYSEASVPAHEQVSDQPGYFKGRSGGLDTGDPETDFRHRNAQRFAREIVQVLENGRQRGAFGHLTLTAAPLFLGVLRSQLSEPLSHLVERSIDKDFTSLAFGEIAERLNDDSQRR